MSYNGYENYETWNVSLWLDNDEGTYGYWADRAEEVLESNDMDKDDALYALAKEIEQEIEDWNPITIASTYSDLLVHALGMVEWAEVAQSFIDLAVERAEDE